MRFRLSTASRSSSHSTRRHARHDRRRLSPRLEPLEGRVVLSTWTVTSTADSGPGSLRAAIAEAGRGDTINFKSSLAGQTISLTSGELAIGQSLTIQGPAHGGVDVDAGSASRVFDITSASAAPTCVGTGLLGQIFVDCKKERPESGGARQIMIHGRILRSVGPLHGVHPSRSLI